jgi:hypothetical protein
MMIHFSGVLIGKRSERGKTDKFYLPRRWRGGKEAEKEGKANLWVFAPLAQRLCMERRVRLCTGWQEINDNIRLITEGFVCYTRMRRRREEIKHKTMMVISNSIFDSIEYPLGRRASGGGKATRIFMMLDAWLVWKEEKNQI